MERREKRVVKRNTLLPIGLELDDKGEGGHIVNDNTFELCSAYQ